VGVHLKKPILLGVFSILLVSTSACSVTRTAAMSTEKKAYIAHGSSFLHCTAEQKKPVCTQVKETESP
jgi:hypothetical protein